MKLQHQRLQRLLHLQAKPRHRRIPVIAGDSMGLKSMTPRRRNWGCGLSAEPGQPYRSRARVPHGPVTRPRELGYMVTNARTRKHAPPDRSPPGVRHGIQDNSSSRIQRAGRMPASRSRRMAWKCGQCESAGTNWRPCDLGQDRYSTILCSSQLTRLNPSTGKSCQLAGRGARLCRTGQQHCRLRGVKP